MEKEIINRVANSKLITIDLEDFYPEGKRVLLDISPWLVDGIFLKEVDFRKSIAAHDWSSYQDNYVAVYCKTDAIIPSWAFMLVSLELAPYVKMVAIGNLNSLETLLFSEIIQELDIEQYRNKPVIVKGCTSKPIPESAYGLICTKLYAVASKIMYGEACSFVPLTQKK